MIHRSVVLGALVAIPGMLAACDAGASQEPGGAFYLEAQVSVDSSGDPTDSSRQALAPQVTGIRWWYRDPEHYRHEWYRPDAVLDWGPQWTVADGEDVVGYDPRTGSYGRQPLAGSGPHAPYPSFSALVGPLPADTLDEFMEEWSGRVETIEHAGAEELLGRTVQVVEYGPTWSSSSESSTPGGGSSAEPEQSGGVGRFYVDVASGFILRHVVDRGAGHQSFDAEVTLLELDPDVDDERFHADLPADAVEAAGSAGSCSSSSGQGPDPALTAGPVRFGYVPDGWTWAGTGSSQGGACQTLEEWSSLRRGAGEIIVASAQPIPPTGVPPARVDATQVDIAGHQGYRLTEGDIERLLWAQDDAIVLIETNAAPFEELLRIAESGDTAP